MTVAVEQFAARKIGMDKVGCYVDGRLFILKYKFLTDDPKIAETVRKISEVRRIDMSHWRPASKGGF